MFQPIEETIKALSKNWWLFVLRGVLAIIFGILCVAWPIASIYVLVIFFGAYAFVDGIFLLMFASRHKESRGSRAWLIFSGIAGIAAGIVTLAWPGITAVALLVVIIVWAFVSGMAQLLFAFMAKTNIGFKLLLALGGVFSIIFGIFLVARPEQGALAVVWIIGFFAVLLGIYHIIFGVDLKHLKVEASAK
jgi:uncharacterized membrane protein HdeD (DUF308 family)